jgi:aryl-alcohol dehydrogenase-like predicted oxidoreductase
LNNKNDVRGALPRFYKENFHKNLKLIAKIKKFAKKKRLTLAQVVLAWILNQQQDIIPIVGMKSSAHVEENLKATSIQLSATDMQELDHLMPVDSVFGEQYPSDMEVR